VLTTYRRDGSAHTVPVWFRWTDEAFEVVIAKGDVKLRHLARDPRQGCSCGSFPDSPRVWDLSGILPR
jgi:hypothetical protein